jgi:hypothetical protein
MILLAAVAAFVVGAYVLLPSFLERSAARTIQGELGLESTPELERGSPWEVLTGRFPGGRVTMEGVGLGGVRAERVNVDLYPLDLDLPASILGGAIESEEPLAGTLEAEVPVRDVELERGRALVRSETSAFGFDVPVVVQGGLALRGGALVFEPLNVSAFGTPLPEQLAERLLAGVDFAYTLGSLPYGVEITGAEVAENRLVLSGEMERVPVGGG